MAMTLEKGESQESIQSCSNNRNILCVLIGKRYTSRNPLAKSKRGNARIAIRPSGNEQDTGRNQYSAEGFGIEEW
jgi:hypothetical protein